MAEQAVPDTIVALRNAIDEHTLELPPPSQRVVAIFEHTAQETGHALVAGPHGLDFGTRAERHV